MFGVVWNYYSSKLKSKQYTVAPRYNEHFFSVP